MSFLSKIGKFGGLGGFGPLQGLFGTDQSGNMKRLFEQMQRDQQLQFTRGLGYQLQAQKAIGTGFDSALREVEGTGDASRQDVLDEGARLQADVGQSMAGHGLSNTTIAGNAQGMARGMKSRALATVNANVAQAKAGLLTQKGMALAGGFGNMSNLMMGQGQGQTALQQLLWQRLASQPSPEDRFWSLLGMTGQGLGMAAGGGFR